MKKPAPCTLILAVVATLLILFVGERASANTIFTLSGVTLSGGGSLTGSFTTNDARSAVVGYDITASATGAFAGFEFTLANSSVSAQVLPSTFFQLDSINSGYELRLIFSNGLMASGGSLSGSSYEFEGNSGGIRLVTAGSVVPAAAASVPDTGSTLALLGLGLGSLAVMRRKVAVV